MCCCLTALAWQAGAVLVQPFAPSRVFQAFTVTNPFKPPVD
jgi:hypothetical protein